MNTTLKGLLDYRDLYKSSIILEELKRNFGIVSFAKKSIPTPGSKSCTTDKIKSFKEDTEILKYISHRNGDITLITNHGFARFTK